MGHIFVDTSVKESVIFPGGSREEWAATHLARRLALSMEEEIVIPFPVTVDYYHP